jgi:hypothetical protein
MFSFAAGIMLVEIVWLVLGVTWLTYHYRDCPVEGAKEAVLGKGNIILAEEKLVA